MGGGGNKDGGKCAIFYLPIFKFLQTRKGLTVKVSFISANYVPLSAGGRGGGL